MKRRVLLAAFCVLLPVLAFAATFSWLPDRDNPPPRTENLVHGLRIMLEPADQTVKAGEVVNFKVSFFNLGPDPLQVIRPIDGSEARWQQPYHDFVAKRENGEVLRWMLMGGRPARMRALSNSDVLPVKKGESIDPRQGPYADYLKSVSFREPGTYEVWYLYVFERVTATHDIDGAPAAVPTALRGVFTSNAVKVIVK